MIIYQQIGSGIDNFVPTTPCDSQASLHKPDLRLRHRQALGNLHPPGSKRIVPNRFLPAPVAWENGTGLGARKFQLHSADADRFAHPWRAHEKSDR